ncbi:hypothetical protein VTO42DRAFT_8928 [Malbranchea cinnamomea]
MKLVSIAVGVLALLPFVAAVPAAADTITTNSEELNLDTGLNAACRPRGMRCDTNSQCCSKRCRLYVEGDSLVKKCAGRI